MVMRHTLIRVVTTIAAVVAATPSSTPSPQKPAREQTFAQVAVGGEAITAFLLSNPLPRPITVQVELFSSSGELRAARQVSLAPEGRERVEFSGGSPKAWAGWAQLTADGEFLATERINNGKSPWVDFTASQPGRTFRVAGSVRLPDLQTGVALANPNRTKASLVTIVLRKKDGTELRRTSFSLAPGRHRSG